MKCLSAIIAPIAALLIVSAKLLVAITGEEMTDEHWQEAFRD